jgi:hypothetical protein
MSFSHPPLPWAEGKAISENKILFEEYLDLRFDERSQNSFRQLVVEQSKTICKKRRGTHRLRKGSGEQMIGAEDNILLIHSKKFRFEQNIFSLYTVNRSISNRNTILFPLTQHTQKTITREFLNLSFNTPDDQITASKVSFFTEVL